MTDTNWLPTLALQSGPKYLALAQAIRQAIAAGTLGPGDRLPPVRDLAWRLSMTPGTAARAYAILTQEGLLEAGVGRGTFVATAKTGPRPDPALTFEEDLRADGPADLRAPQLPEIGQQAAFLRLMTEAAATSGRADLAYPTLRNDLHLRQQLPRWMAHRSLGAFDAEDIVLSYGGQNAIALVMQTCLRADRQAVFVEELSYAGFRHAARLSRAEPIPVAIDDQGMIPEALEAACKRHGGRLLCLTPEAQNPTAARMPEARRRALIAVARAHDLQIIEDECYPIGRDIAALPALRSLAPERVWHISSLSKTVSAGLRFGWILCPEGQALAARTTAQHSFFGLARPLVDVIQRLMESGAAEELRAAVAAVVERRLALAVARLGPYGLRWQPGLSFCWLPLPGGWRASTFLRAAEAEGILLRSADEYALADGRAPHAVRIAISGAMPEVRFT
ncbi:PLP-dependent aminotransferase family protein, partial [Thioclava sp. BHET1]